MVTPTMTFRVRAERQDAVREVVNAIKDDPDLTASVLQVLHARSTNGSTTATTGNLGPFRSEDAALSFLVGRLTASLRPEAIFLFGSRAAGREKPTSDFDLHGRSLREPTATDDGLGASPIRKRGDRAAPSADRPPGGYALLSS